MAKKEVFYSNDLVGGVALTSGSPPLQDHKYFDSADWALQKEQVKKGVPMKEEEQNLEDLPAKMRPSPPTSRRVSHLESMEKASDIGVPSGEPTSKTP
jgi:hypothetical protein